MQNNCSFYGFSSNAQNMDILKNKWHTQTFPVNILHHFRNEANITTIAAKVWEIDQLQSIATALS